MRRKQSRQRREKTGTPVLMNRTTERDDRNRGGITPLPDTARRCPNTSPGTLHPHPRGENNLQWESGERSPTAHHTSPSESGQDRAHASFQEQPAGCHNLHDTRLLWVEWELTARFPCAY